MAKIQRIDQLEEETTLFTLDRLHHEVQELFWPPDQCKSQKVKFAISQGVEKEPLSEEKPLQFQANFWEEQRPGEKLRMGKEYPSSRDCEEPPAWTHLSG
jgi:hypothetical protein